MAGINQKRVHALPHILWQRAPPVPLRAGRLGPMLWELDTSKDGIISLDEWDSAIAIALDKKLEQRAAARSTGTRRSRPTRGSRRRST